MLLFQLGIRLINIQKVIKNAPKKGISISEKAEAEVISWRKKGVKYYIIRSLEDIASKQLPFKTATTIHNNGSDKKCVEMLPILDADPSLLKDALRNGKFKIKWNLHVMTTFPLLREIITIYDNLHNPYKLEVFNNVTGPDVQDYIRGLLYVRRQRFSFHDNSGKTIVAYDVPLGDLYRLRVLVLFKKAIKHLYRISLSTRDFEKAYNQYIKENP